MNLDRRIARRSAANGLALVLFLSYLLEGACWRAVFEQYLNAASVLRYTAFSHASLHLLPSVASLFSDCKSLRRWMYHVYCSYLI